VGAAAGGEGGGSVAGQQRGVGVGGCKPRLLSHPHPLCSRDSRSPPPPHTHPLLLAATWSPGLLRCFGGMWWYCRRRRRCWACAEALLPRSLVPGLQALSKLRAGMVTPAIAAQLTEVFKRTAAGMVGACPGAVGCSSARWPVAGGALLLALLAGGGALEHLQQLGIQRPGTAKGSPDRSRPPAVKPVHPPPPCRWTLQACCPSCT
jgi:hypothetical protein